jgi:hypothetical protein
MKLHYFVLIFAFCLPQLNNGGIRGKLNLWKEWMRTHPIDLTPEILTKGIYN